MHSIKLTESEYRFATIIWANEPISSPDLVSLCQVQLGWKKSTVYTVLKKLIEKGVFQNQSTMVSSLIPQSEIQKFESSQIIEKAFQGSLPKFVSTFLSQHSLTQEEAEEIQDMIQASFQKKSK